jgi:hypothetical protein
MDVTVEAFSPPFFEYAVETGEQDEIERGVLPGKRPYDLTSKASDKVTGFGKIQARILVQNRHQ